MAQRTLFRVLEIQDFRGFARPQRFELDASVVIVGGPNGTGKTSFFDAVQWLLLGSLPRLEAHASRRSEDYIVNRWSESQIATVSAELQIDGRRVYLRRRGSATRSRLELEVEGALLKDDVAQQRLSSLLLGPDGGSLQEALSTSGLLQQDDLRALIAADPKERYTHLTRMLGLEELPDYAATARTNADALSKEAKERRAALGGLVAQLQDASRELEITTKQFEEAPSARQLLRDISASLLAGASGLTIDGGFPLDAGRLSNLGTAARRMRERAAELLAGQRRLAEGAVDRDENGPHLLQDAIEEVHRLSEELRAVVAALSTAERELQEAERASAKLADLAVRALPLLGTHCPVCQQVIDGAQVGEHLKRILAEEPAELRGMRERIQDATNRRDMLEQDSNRAVKQRDALLAQRALVERRNEEMAAWASTCAGLADGIGPLRPVDALGVREGSASALEEVWQAAGEVERATREAAAAIAVPELGGKIEEQRARVEQLTAEVSQLRDEVAALNRRAEVERSLAHAAAEAVANVTTRRFELLAPLVSEIYSRLDPHPAFTRLNYSLGVHYQRPVADPVVVDEQFDVTAEPLLVFSSSQANVAALTFFLALSWTAGSHALPFLMLDDPLQAMDDINALGFADLCRHIRSERQLVVSTHDKRLAGLLERKLAPRAAGERTLMLRFLGWDRSGPQVEQQEVAPQLDAAERRVLMEAA